MNVDENLRGLNAFVAGAKEGSYTRGGYRKWRPHENPDLTRVRRSTVEHPFGIIKRM